MDQQKYEDLLSKVESSGAKKLDLSSDEDLSVAIMNLVGIEEHLFFTAQKTNKEEYFDLLNEVRSMRTELLKKIIKDYEGEVWCISKHLLAASYRLYEVGTKQFKMGNKEEAKNLFDKAFNLYSLFWALNLKMIGVGEVKKIPEGALSKEDKKPEGFMGKFGELLKKVIDCCIE
ncbi:MAG TPA: hypothetical protein PKM84_01990 [Candidatus Pacearchaeota archaeon]|nr:hypothetical protein [Candidatus Pacearchaeota archaeon]